MGGAAQDVERFGMMIQSHLEARYVGSGPSDHLGRVGRTPGPGLVPPSPAHPSVRVRLGEGSRI